MKKALFFSLLLISTFLADKISAQSSYFNSFKTNNPGDVILGGNAKLTSGIEDPVNNGVLRLTAAQQDKTGFAYINTAFPSLQGIKVEFEFFTYGGTMADGITFFLFDGTSTFESGQYGGALGYAQNNNNGTGRGMKNGFLALGLDEYGNFGAATETKNGGFKKATGVVYTSPISANGLVVVRGGVGPLGEREGPTAYPFLGGKITSPPYGSIDPAWPDDILPPADRFGIATNNRAMNETDPDFRKVRLDIKRLVGTGYVINVEVFVGALGRWIKVLDNFAYSIADNRIPATLKAGFSASTGWQYNHHEIRNVRITPSAAVLATPTANNDVAIGIMNQAKTITVLSNDNAAANPAGTFQPGSIDLNPLTPVIDNTSTLPGKGTFAVDNAGLVTFTPINAYSGTASVDYNFMDSFGMTSSTASISVTINSANSKPTVTPLSKTGSEDSPVVFTVTDFTSKYIDPENDPLTKIKISSLPANGTLKLNATNILINQEINLADLGNITFVPNANWNGSTTFNWNGHDGNNFAVTDAIVTITINGVNDIPAIDPFSKNGIEDTPIPFSQTDFSAKFSDPDNDVLAKIKITSLPPTGILKLNGINITVNQEIPFAQLNAISFVPNADWNGSTSFLYNGSDGISYAPSDQSIFINVSAINDAPVVANISKTGVEGNAVAFTASDFSSKFTDIENDGLNKIKISSLPANGTLKLNNTAISVNQEIPFADLSNLVFVPNPLWNGTTTFTWNGSDGNSYANTDALVNITINAVNDAPVVANISKTGTEDTPLAFSAADFSSKFSDPDNDALNKIKIISLPLNGILKLSGANITVNQEIAFASLGNITFTPDLNWNGSTSFNWNGSDVTTYAPANALVNIVITAVNDLPLVASISKSGQEDTALPFSALDFTSKFTDTENDPLVKIKVHSLSADGILRLSGVRVTENQEIPVADLANLTFLPNANWSGNTSFKWYGSDGSNYSASSELVQILIVGEIDPPTAVDDSKEADLNKPVEISVLDNDFADGLTIDNTSLVIINNPQHGQLVVSPTGIVTYTPNDKYAGSDSFTYRVKDTNGNLSNLATVSITVKGFVMSNVFTPNGDGKNDTFVILGIENYDRGDLTVFNRWGNEVYRNATYDNSWDGSGLNAGTYFFIVKLKKGSTEDLRKGWLLLKR